MYIPRERLFWAVSLGHAANDILMSMGPVLLAFIGGVYFPITEVQIGLAVSARQMLGAISQPGFGYLADRGNSRLYGAGGVAWTVAMVLLAMLLAMTTRSFWLMIVPFALSALGSGAFHPVGTMQAAQVNEERANSNTAWFFLLGQMGLALGPVTAGALLGLTQRGDAEGSVAPIFLYALVGIPAVWLMITTMPSNAAQKLKDAATEASEKAVAIVRQPITWGPLILLALMVLTRGLAYPGSVAFIPVLFRNKGWDPAAYGLITSFYWIASAIAGVYMGNLADRFDRRIIIAGSLFAVVPVYVMLPLVDGTLAFVLALLAGVLSGGTHSVIVVLAQKLIPGKKGFASGMPLGFIFGVGALGTLLIGFLADGAFGLPGLGLTRAFQSISIFVLVAGFLGLLLPGGTGTDIHLRGKRKKKKLSPAAGTD